MSPVTALRAVTVVAMSFAATAGPAASARRASARPVAKVTNVAELAAQGKAAVFLSVRVTNPLGVEKCDRAAVRISTTGKRGSIATQSVVLASAPKTSAGIPPMRLEVAPGAYAINMVGCRNRATRTKTEFRAAPGKSFAIFVAKAGEAVDLGLLSLDTGQIATDTSEAFGSATAGSRVLIFIDDMPSALLKKLKIRPRDALKTRHMVATLPPTIAMMEQQCAFHRKARTRHAARSPAGVKSKLPPEHVCSRLSKSKAEPI